MALRVVEILVSVLLLLILTMQVIIPVARGRKVFPFFRRQGKLEARLDELRQKQDEDELEKAINQRASRQSAKKESKQ